MNIKTSLAQDARDVRLDLFLGIANWFLFLDHIPDNVVSSFTMRNFGFSGASDAFVFIIGYTASLTYASIMLERGTLVGVTRVFKRAWQLYAAYIVLFAIYIVTIGDVAARYAAPDIFYEFNITGCRYADFFRELGEPELGALLLCDMDLHFIEQVGAPDVELTRTQTIMKGASYCDFRFKLK